MVFKVMLNFLQTRLRKQPLRVVLVAPFILQIFGTVGVVGYLSFRSGRATTNTLITQLQEEISDRIVSQLESYLAIPKLINRINADAIVRGELSLDLDSPQSSAEIERYLWHQIRLFESVTWIGLASESSGAYLGITRQAKDRRLEFSISNRANNYNITYYDIDANNGRRLQPLKPGKPYDARKRPWYKIPAAARRMSWGNIYSGFATQTLYLSNTNPIYNDRDRLVGMTSVDFTLDHINSFLKNFKIGRSGQGFIIDREGNLIATSTNEMPFVAREEKIERVSPRDSNNILVRATGEYLQQETIDLSEIREPRSFSFQLEGKRQLIRLTPFNHEFDLEWTIVLVIPETDFMEQIQANTRNTIILCTIALIVATMLGIFTVKWVTQPILHLNRSAKELARSQWHQIMTIQREDELGELAKSFNSMAVQLRDAFATLEQRVAERTAELAESNQQLEIAKEKADAANKAKSIFLANMSHELRTPLNAILGFSQILTRSQRLAPEQQENVNVINRSGEYLLTLINNVLNLSKIEAGKTTLNPIDFDLHSLLDEVEQMLYIKAEEKGLQLHFDCADNVPRFIRGDLVKLNQVLINLINNGIKFTREGGISVRITHPSFQSPVTGDALRPLSEAETRPLSRQSPLAPLRKEGKENNQKPTTIHFEIEDTGVGIAPEEIRRIFEAFGQSQSGAAAKEGTGLGLPISRKFVQLMGGDITVQSQLNRGTTFQFDIRVTLAQYREIATRSSRRRAIAIASSQPSNYRLLIVDDKSVNRQLLIKLLGPFGFSLKEARDGREALEIWQNWQPHLIWMDLRMPIMDGYESARVIQTTSEGKKTKIIAITASVLEEEKAVVLAAGFADFIRKPFRENDIFQALEKHLEIDFIYQESCISEESNTLFKLAPDDLAILPKIWLQKFQQAIVEGRIKKIENLVREIPLQNKRIATALLDLVSRYEFEYILELIQKIDSLP
ncbi:MAG: response regulator [Cyanobacteria bacterium SBLK]|nr:response regulator [Cyanobacteria bacterium SBLK]